jgi:N-methylhydantoinase B/oxoprolinase/acetone carboxylase alpha subunit
MVASRSRYKKSNGITKISQNRIAWANISIGTIATIQVPEEKRYKTTHALKEMEPGDNVYLEIPTGGGFTQLIDLTKLTAQELEYLAQVIEIAVTAAKPICEKRDQHATAADKFDDGSATLYARNYIPVPQLFSRPRVE